MEVLYHIRPYFGGISPYIGLIYGRYLQFRFLKWPLNIGQNLDMLVWNKHVLNGRYSTLGSLVLNKVFRVSNGTSNLSVLTILTHSHVNPMV